MFPPAPSKVHGCFVKINVDKTGWITLRCGELVAGQLPHHQIADDPVNRTNRLQVKTGIIENGYDEPKKYRSPNSTAKSRRNVSPGRPDGDPGPVMGRELREGLIKYQFMLDCARCECDGRRECDDDPDTDNADRVQGWSSTFCHIAALASQQHLFRTARIGANKGRE
jgi:hypothetical protein